MWHFDEMSNPSDFVMPENRRPLASTSFSGIPDAVNDAMKATAADQGMTYREAVEEACTALLRDLDAGEPVDWTATVTGSKVRGIRLDHKMIDALNKAAAARNY